jgi:hypothetical protein
VGVAPSIAETIAYCRKRRIAQATRKPLSGST